eukprot:m.66572 g.66572  ORF g.66572 m.66572 type:complete len:75 (-) comp12123_c0_seq1:101-325(-)
MFRDSAETNASSGTSFSMLKNIMGSSRCVKMPRKTAAKQSTNNEQSQQCERVVDIVCGCHIDACSSHNVNGKHA